MSVDVFSSHMNAERVQLDPARAAVVVVDMINEFCKPGGKMVLPGYERLVPPQLAVIEAAREVGSPVIWVRDSHRRNLRRDREWVKRTPHGVEGTWATEVIEDLGARSDEIHVINGPLGVGSNKVTVKFKTFVPDCPSVVETSLMESEGCALTTWPPESVPVLVRKFVSPL